MKQIELTEDYKSKLLEITKFLFPDIKWQFYDVANGYVEHKFYDEFWVVQNNSELYPVYIHWFEFCIKYLIPKLNKSITTIVDMRILFCELPNPIDYLYDKFKQS